MATTKRTYRRIINSLVLIVSTMTIACSYRYKKYESNWIVTKFTVNGIDSMEAISIYNFSINVELSKGNPPALHSGTIDQVKSDCNIKFINVSGNDFVVVSGHYFFSGKYELNCLTKNCCTLSMQNDRIYLELDYNGDLPFGKSRKCPPPRLELID